MRRFWILFLTEIKASRNEPISVIGGLILPIVLLFIFGLMFAGERALPIAVINHDIGSMGPILVKTIQTELSPFNSPYYKVINLSEDKAWQAYRDQRIDAVWIIPDDFSARLKKGRNPGIDMHFTNYMDDRGKNHRIYSAEILWSFYKKIGQPGPPLEIAEHYPLPNMVDWFWIIGVGLVLLGVMLGGMFNIFMLTYKERISKVALEFGMSPRPLPLILLPKMLLALIISLVIGTIILLILNLWIGIWPGGYIWAVYLLCCLVAIYWISLMLVIGLRARHHMAGAIGMVMTGVIIFFTCGALSMVRYLSTGVLWFARVFPNTHAIDPLRELILFQKWPSNWTSTLVILVTFAVISLTLGLIISGRQLRRIY